MEEQMCTRCQVEVKAEGLSWKESSVMLYHHCDGYPTNMLPLIRESWDRFKNRDEMRWQLGRCGKVAAMLCWADPTGYEVERGVKLHCDIEWFYVVRCLNSAGGSMAEDPRWIVEVYVPEIGVGFCNRPVREKLILVDKGEVEVIAFRAKEVEKKSYRKEG